MWRYKMTLIVRPPDAQAGVERDERRVVIRLKARNNLEARRRALEMVWQRKMLVSTILSWEAKRKAK